MRLPRFQLSLSSVLALVFLSLFCLPLAGLGVAQVYQSALVRQTEAELIVCRKEILEQTSKFELHLNKWTSEQRTLQDRITQVKGVEAEACRMTGGEYALIVNGGLPLGRQAAIGVLKKLAEPLNIDSISTRLSGSIGVAVYPDHGAREKILGNAALAGNALKNSVTHMTLTYRTLSAASNKIGN